VDENTFAIELTEPELAYIANLLWMPHIGGQWSPEDAQKAEAQLQAAAGTLADKGYLRPSLNGDTETTLDEIVAMMMLVLGYPQFGLSLESFRHQEMEPQETRLFGLGDLFIEQTRGADGRHILTACRSPAVARERVLAALGLANQPPAHTSSFEIDAERMAQLPLLIAGGGLDDAIIALREQGAPAPFAARFVAALDNPVRQSLIEAIGSEGERQQIADRFTLLEDLNGLWLIAPSKEEDQLRIQPVAAKSVAERLRGLIVSSLAATAG
jgi:hypothetical protein